LKKGGEDSEADQRHRYDCREKRGKGLFPSRDLMRNFLGETEKGIKKKEGTLSFSPPWNRSSLSGEFSRQNDRKEKSLAEKEGEAFTGGNFKTRNVENIVLRQGPRGKVFREWGGLTFLNPWGGS